jgi:hypothetical protein
MISNKTTNDIPAHWLAAVEELSQLAGRSDPAYRTAFEALATSQFLTDLTTPRLLALCDPNSHLERVSRRYDGTSWLLYGDEHITLILAIVSEPDGTYVDTPPTDISMAVVGPGCLRVERYRTTFPLEESEVCRADHLLETLGTTELTAGIALHLSAQRDPIRFVHCDRPLPVLRMGVQSRSAPLCWHYDTTTGQPIGYSHTNQEASQTEFLLSLIAEQKRRDRIDFVSNALAHPAHAVRWSAVKALWALDSERAAAATRRCLDDSHPHVRNAAAATLRLLAAQTAQPSGAPSCL